jgi:hypothetical protein
MLLYGLQCSHVSSNARLGCLCSAGVEWLALAQVLAAQRMLESKYNDAVRGADDWGRRAELAVRSSNDDLAREALRRKKAFTVRLPRFQRVEARLLAAVTYLARMHVWGSCRTTV